MRGRWMVVWAIAGCSSWRTVGVTSLDHENAYVATDREAYELDDARFDGQHVIGTRRHAWPITTCEYDATRSPTEIARTCHWHDTSTSAEVVELDAASVSNVHVKRVDPSAVIAGVGVGVAVVLAAVVAFSIWVTSAGGE